MDEEERRAYTNSCMHFFKFNADTLAPIFDDLTPRARGEALNAVYGLALYGEEPGRISKAARSAYMCAAPTCSRHGPTPRSKPTRRARTPDRARARGPYRGGSLPQIRRRQLGQYSASTRRVLMGVLSEYRPSTRRVQGAVLGRALKAERGNQQGKRPPYLRTYLPTYLRTHYLLWDYQLWD